MLHSDTLSVLLKDGPSAEALSGLITCPQHYYHNSGGDCGHRQNAEGEGQENRGADQNANAETEASGGTKHAAGA